MSAHNVANDLALRDLVRLLMLREGGDTLDPAKAARVADEVCQKLQDYLLTIIGSTGFRAMLGRALNLTRMELPSLAGIELRPEEGAELTCIPDALRGSGHSNTDETVIALLANLLGVVVELLGPEFLHRILVAAWPDVDFGEGSSQPR